jgi:hypothetical protein
LIELTEGCFFDYFKATYLLFFDRFVIVFFRKNNQGNSGGYCAFYFMLTQVQQDMFYSN